MNRPVVMVTGGSRGIGAAVAVGAAAAGYDVVITWIADESAAIAVSGRIEREGGRALAVRCDVADEHQVLAAFSALDNTFGRLDALVNNAGVLAGGQDFADYPTERIRRILDVNVFGAMIVAREAARRMSTRRAGSGGVIVNLSSAAARLGAPGEYIDYAASKGAIDTLTLGLAKELGNQGVRVNAVRPGLIETDIHASGGRPDRVRDLSHLVPMQRGGTAQEVADTILWLMSPRSSYVTGALIDVGGGR